MARLLSRQCAVNTQRLSWVAIFLGIVYLVTTFKFSSVFHKTLTCPELQLINRSHQVNLYNSNMRQKKVLTIQFTGPLGTHLFQFASAYAISKSFGRTLVIQNSDVLSGFEKISAEKVSDLRSFISSFHNSDVIFFPENPHYRARYFEKTFRCLQLVQEKVLALHGYFQSWKYFKRYSERIKAELAFSKTAMTEADSFLSSSREGPTVVIGVHVKRADMAHVDKFADDGFVPARKTFLMRALDFYTQKFKEDRIRFIITSSSMEWCQSNFQNSIYDIVYFTGSRPEVDMYLLTQCDHLVITVGSFGWWAGFLSKGQVVYQSEVAEPGSEYERIMQYSEDYFPVEWTPM